MTDLDLSHAAAPSGPFAELVADKRVTLTAQAALGRLLQGDEDRAADLMRELPAADRGRVAEAATMLAIGCSVLDDATEPVARPAVRDAPGTGDPDAGTGTPDTAETRTAGRDHTHECACNRNWGGPCEPCICEEPPRQGVWRLTCGAGNVPPNQTYATKGAAEDVMRLHDGACPCAHGVEFVPDAGADQTEDDHA